MLSHESGPVLAEGFGESRPSFAVQHEPRVFVDRDAISKNGCEKIRGFEDPLGHGKRRGIGTMEMTDAAHVGTAIIDLQMNRRFAGQGWLPGHGLPLHVDNDKICRSDNGAQGVARDNDLFGGQSSANVPEAIQKTASIKELPRFYEFLSLLRYGSKFHLRTPSKIGDR